MRAGAPTADQLDCSVAVAVGSLQPLRMLSLAVSGLAFGLVEERVADAAQVGVGISDGLHSPVGVPAEPVLGGLGSGEEAAGVAGGGALGWCPSLGNRESRSRQWQAKDR